MKYKIEYILHLYNIWIWGLQEEGRIHICMQFVGLEK